MFQFALMLIVAEFTSSKGDCIVQSSDLVDSIFNDVAYGNKNWDSLRSAFFPPNERENQIITIHYYYTTSNSSKGNFSVDMFRWSWSSTIFFIYPDALQHLAVYSIILGSRQGQAEVYIGEPFCENLIQNRVFLLNEFTTLVSK